MSCQVTSANISFIVIITEYSEEKIAIFYTEIILFCVVLKRKKCFIFNYIPKKMGLKKQRQKTKRKTKNTQKNINSL